MHNHSILRDSARLPTLLDQVGERSAQQSAAASMARSNERPMVAVCRCKQPLCLGMRAVLTAVAARNSFNAWHMGVRVTGVNVL